MAFDPDAWLASNATPDKPKEPSFDPDAWLASNSVKEEPAKPAAFDPDAWLASNKVEEAPQQPTGLSTLPPDKQAAMGLAPQTERLSLAPKTTSYADYVAKVRKGAQEGLPGYQERFDAMIKAKDVEAQAGVAQGEADTTLQATVPVQQQLQSTLAGTTFGLSDIALEGAKRSMGIEEGLNREYTAYGKTADSVVNALGTLFGGLMTGKAISEKIPKMSGLKGFLLPTLGIATVQGVSNAISNLTLGRTDPANAAIDIANNVVSALVSRVAGLKIPAGKLNAVGQVATDFVYDLVTDGVIRGRLKEKGFAEWMASEIPMLVASIVGAGTDYADPKFKQQQKQFNKELTDLVKGRASKLTPEQMAQEVATAQRPPEEPTLDAPEKAVEVPSGEPPAGRTPLEEGTTIAEPVAKTPADAEAIALEKQLTQKLEEGKAKQAEPEAVSSDIAQQPTSIRNRQTDIEREKLGLAPAEPVIERTFGTVAKDAEVEFTKNPNVGKELIDTLEANPGRALSDTEDAILLREQVDLQSQARKEVIKLVEAEQTGNETAKASVEKNLADIRDKLYKIYEIDKRAGTATARGLAARRMFMDEQYNVFDMQMEMRANKKGKPLTEDELKNVERMSSDFEATRAKYDAEVERLKQEISVRDEEIAKAKANSDFEEIVRQVVKEPAKPRTFSKRMVDLADKLESEALESMRLRTTRMSAGLDPTVLVDMGKLGTAYVIRGAVNFSVWATKMRAAFKGINIEPELENTYKSAMRQVADEARKDAPIKVKKDAKGKADITEFSILVKELYKQEVRNGVRNLGEATKNVHEALVKEDPTITLEKVRDEFSDYGKVKVPKGDVVSKTMADLRRQAQLLASIERVQKKMAPLKTGLQRDKPTQEQRELGKQLAKLMKDAGIETTDKATQLATTQEAIKTRLLNDIADLDKAINTTTKMVSSRGVTKVTPEITALREQKDALRKRYDEIFAREKTELTYEQKLGRSIAQTERNLSEINNRIAKAKTGIFGKEIIGDKPWNMRLSNLKNQQKQARAELQQLKDLANPKKSEIQIAVDNKRKRLEAATKEMQRRIKENDFSKREVREVDIANDPAALAAKADNERVKIEFANAKEVARRANRSVGEVIKEGLIDVAHTQKNIISAFDISAPGRQGGMFALAHPVMWAKGFAPMFRSMNQAHSMKLNAEIFARPNSTNGIYKKAGLGLSKDDGTGNFLSVEDSHKLNLSSKVPGVNASNRAYATFLNKIRADLFDKLLANSKDPADISDAKIKAIADGVNVMTGRGDVGRGAEAMATVLWAPRFLKSAFDVLTLKPLRSGIGGGKVGTSETRAMFAKEYLKMLGSLATIYAVAGLFERDNMKVEMNPTSADFGAIHWGKHTINPIGFTRPLLTFLARMVTGEMKTSAGTKKAFPWGGWIDYARTGSDKKLNEPIPYSNSGNKPLWRFLQSKSHPTVGTLLSLFSGETFSGDKITAKKGMYDMAPLPLSVKQTPEFLKTEDIDTASTLILLNYLGFPVSQDYSEKKAQKRSEE